MKKKEIIFISSILLFAVVLWIFQNIFFSAPKNTISISVDGELYGTYPLDTDQIIPINDTNVCEIKNGEVFMIEASCPDQYCIHQKAITSDGGTIICLPNKVIIKGENLHDSSSDDMEIDAVT